MKLEGGERLVLSTLRDLQGDTTGYVTDARLAAATHMHVSDVRDWLETLEGKGFVERARGTEGFSAYITAKGKQALRMTEPMPPTGQVVSEKTGEPFGPSLGRPAVITEAVAVPSDDSRRTDDLITKLEEYLTDDRHRMRLDRLIRETTEAAYEASLRLHERGHQLARTTDSYAEWLFQYDSIMKPLLTVVIHGCRWGQTQHIDLWGRCIDRMAGILGENLGFTPILDLRSYPATLLLYGGGIASAAAGRYDTLDALFQRSQVRRWGESTLPAALVLHGAARLTAPNGSYSLDDFMKRLPNRGQRYTATSDHLNDVLRVPMRSIEPDDYKYNALFDRFECLLALTVGQIQAGPVKRHPHIAEARPTLPLLGTSMPVGRFGWRRNNHADGLATLKQEQARSGPNWPPLKAGMFEGDPLRFQALLGSLESRVREKGWE